MAEDAGAPQGPYRGHKFRLCWNGTQVAGFSQARALSRTLPAITLERGVTCDPGFADWVHTAAAHRRPVPDGGHGGTAGGPASAIALPRDISLEIYDETGQKVLAYRLCRCRPTAAVTLPDGKAGGQVVVLSMLTLAYEGGDRDGGGQQRT